MKPRIVELELDNQLCFALYDASRSFTRAYAPLLGHLGLTYPQYLAMLVLWQADGAVPMSQLGDSLHLDSGTLTPLLKRLHRQGLAERTRDPSDERRVLIALTPSGRELRARASAVPNQIYQACGVDPDTARVLLDTLSQIARTLEHTETPSH